MSPKVSVIILNAFDSENLKECLKSLKETDYPEFETIVVDFSSKNIRELINSNFSNVRLIELSGKDIGPSAMHNVGISNMHPESKYVAFLDNDTIVDKKWLLELVKCIEKNDKVGAVQSKIYIYGQEDILNTNGNKSNYLAVGWPEGYKTRDSKDDRVREISFPSGAAMILRKSALDEIGLFDEDYFIYADDMDVGLRIRLAGYKIMYCPNSLVYHKYKFLRSKRSFYYLNRNRILTFLKLYQKRTYFGLLPAILVYEFFVISYAVLNGFMQELLRAYLYIIKNRKSIEDKRCKIMIYKKISDAELIRSLEGAINFSEIMNPIVKLVLNPFLEGYKKMILSIVEM